MDYLKLEYEIKHRGMTIAQVCEKTGIPRSTFYKKCRGISEFTLSEIKTICECVGLKSPMGIFFDEKVS